MGPLSEKLAKRINKTMEKIGDESDQLSKIEKTMDKLKQ